MHTNTPFFVKLGAGLSDYTGDRPPQNTGHPFDLQDLVRSIDGTRPGFPFILDGEMGYQLSPKWALAAGFQAGSYPVSGAGSFADSWRYTPHVLGRYTFGPSEESPSFYLDLGANATFGGTSTGYGPSIGGGVDVPISDAVSAYVESRFNFTLPDDAIDGAKGPLVTDKVDNPEGSVTGPFDSVNKLLGFGLKINFGMGLEDTSPDEPVASIPSSDSVEKPPNESPYPDTSQDKESIRVPSGTFIMGLTDEDPLSIQSAGRKRVTISPFYIERREVTNAEYRDYLSQLSSDERGERLPDSTAWTKARTEESWEVYFRSDYYSDYPVVGVTWDEARAYCQAHDKRLPTEAEWEYAARAGHLGRVYPWNGLTTRGPNGDYLANFKPPEGYAADGYAFTAPVGAFPPNNWGLYEMAGNVAEWTRDAYTPSYDNLSDFNPYYRDEEESRRVVRGGAWNSDSFFIGVGVRDTQPRDEASIEIGFRCASEAASLDSGDAPEDTTETGNVPE